MKPFHVLAGALACMLVASIPAAAQDAKAVAVEVKIPWSRATPAGAKVAAGYLTIENAGDTPDRLVSASAEIAGRTEIHDMTVKDGVMIMRELPDGLAAPAKSEVKLAPGGLHLMFLDLKRQPKADERFAGTLTFEKAGEIKVEFVVRPIGAPAPDQGAATHGHMHHGTEKSK